MSPSLFSVATAKLLNAWNLPKKRVYTLKERLWIQSKETLIRNARLVLCMDDLGQELADCDIRIVDGVITEVGQNLQSDGKVLLAQGCLVTPGLVNTHHHLFQTFQLSEQ